MRAGDARKRLGTMGKKICAGLGFLLAALAVVLFTLLLAVPFTILAFALPFAGLVP